MKKALRRRLAERLIPAPRMGSAAMARSLILLLQIAAAWIRLLRTPREFAEYSAYGWAFLAMGTGQLVVAALMLAPAGRSVLVLSLLWNGGIVALWLLTRALGLPIGPSAGARVPIEFPDALATSLEMASIVLLLMLLGGRFWGSIRRPVALAVIGGVSVLLMTGVTYADSAYRKLCTHFNPRYGSLAAIDGHSMLPRGSRPYLLPLGQETTIEAGMLVNCGPRTLQVRNVEVLSSAGNAARVSMLTVLPGLHPQSEPSSRHRHGKQNSTAVPPTDDEADRRIFARVLPVRPGRFYLNGLKITYLSEGRTRAQVFATNVVVEVAGKTASPRTGGP